MKKKIDNKNRNIIDEIYYSFKDRYRYNLDLGCHGKTLDFTETSGNLEFVLETQQTFFENVYLNIYIQDYKNKNKIFAGFFYFKDNNGAINKNMMLYAYDIIEAGNEIMQQIFEEIA